jgi:hypothetical protein
MEQPTEDQHEDKPDVILPGAPRQKNDRKFLFFIIAVLALLLIAGAIYHYSSAGYDAEDLANFVGTQWGVLNAVSDFATHTTPNRMTDTYWENNWGKVMEGHPVMDKAYDLLKAM